jgi:hypothetical protein
MHELLKTLAAKAHAHQLVPFLGAGCSLGQVALDWDGITQLMASHLPAAEYADNAQVAEAYAQAMGEAALAAFLAEHLLIKALRDDRESVPLLLLALELRAIYTTNQDNVFELSAESYGRPMVIVATIDDLRGVRPGDRVLYKFHGSLNHPQSLVFTDSQYRSRMATVNHFMDIRLRSDLLTKSLLFVGYSFRDPNIKKLFQELRVRFPDSLPGSYLIAYRWSSELQELCSDFGIECIDPARYIEAPSTVPGENLEQFLQLLCDQTLSLYRSAELQDLMTTKTPIPSRVVIRRQIEAVTRLASSGAPDAIAAFRGTCDRAVIPSLLQSLVADALVDIIRHSPPEHQFDLKGALFNLRLNIMDMLKPAAAYIAFSNRLPAQPLSIHAPPELSFPKSLLPVAAAIAVQLLFAWNEPLTDNFYSRSSQWFDQIWMPLPEELKNFVRPWIHKAWTFTHTIYENPISRAHRLSAVKHPFFVAKTYADISKDLIASLPKRFPTPLE